MNLLIVDDHAINLKLLRAQLEAEGHTVLEAANGAEALHVLEREHVDGIISDILMPVMDGYRLCLEVRNSAKYWALPFILYTSTYNSPQDRELAQTVGADRYIIKPSPTAVILDALREAAQRARSTAQPAAVAPDETHVLKQYNEALVHKLEEKNLELQENVVKLGAAHQEILEREERFRQLAENIREVFFLIEPSDTKVLYISPAYEQIWGRSCESVYARPQSWEDAIHPDDLDAVQKSNDQMAKSGELDYEYRIVRPDSTVRWIHARGFPIRNAAGHLYRIAGIAEDITERRQSAEALRESERRFSGMLANVELASLMLDRSARITYCNDYLLQLTGWQREEVLGRDWFELFIPRDLDLKGVFADLLADLPQAWHNENDILTRSGERRLIRWNNSVLRSASGEVIGTASIGEDITERKVQERKIEKLSRIRAFSGEINAAIVRVREQEALLREACRIAAKHGGFELVWIAALDLEKRVVRPVAWTGFSDADAHAVTWTTIDAARGPIGQAAQTKKVSVRNDIEAQMPSGRLRQVALSKGCPSTVCLPLVVEDRVVALISLYASGKGFFDDEELALLDEMGSNISFALESIARQEKIDRLSRIRAVSREINAAIVRIPERQRLLDETCRIVTEHGGFDLSWIGTIDPVKEVVSPAAWTGFSAEVAHAVTWASIGASRGTIGEVISTRKPAVRHNLSTDISAGTLRREAIDKGFLSSVCLPLQPDGGVSAVLILFAREPDFFDAEELALLEEVGADIWYALQGIERQEQLDYLSYYDTLTGLPNRTLFIDRAGQQMHARSGDATIAALVLLNLERFRNINETLGRQGGDELLKQVAGRLETAFRGNDYLARIGADNFGIVIRGIRDVPDAAHVLESKIFTIFNAPFIVGDHELRVAAKAGLALFPSDGGDADTLFKNAEAALKRGKDSRERYLFYAAEMNARAAQALSLETRLRKAVDAQEFVLYYQPKLELASGRICGLEALIRWQEPGGRLVPPGDFIPLLEETGLILQVGKWALAQALADYRDWTARGLAPPRIAVNVSAIQLQQQDFVDVVISVVQEAGDLTHAIELEVTESLIMKDVQASTRKLSILRGLGITIAMDDFGTGYSSLSYVARLPLDSLKIDRSFINGMASGDQDMAIVSTIIALAHSLKLKVVAEGVETQEQAGQLRSLKCDDVQGFLYSKPLPAEALEVMLRVPTFPAPQR